GTPPDLDGEAGALWLFAGGSEANRARPAGQLNTAHATYDLIRQRVEGAGAESRDRHLAPAYHNPGVVAQDRGDPAAAEAWCRKSLEMKEALSDRPGMASTYHQLGSVAQDRGDLAAARSLVSQVAGDQGGARKPTGHGHELPPTWHGGAASRRSCRRRS